MSKTAADVKKGLAMCSADECRGQHTDCPYHPELMCIRNICGDSLVLIQQLEATVSEKEKVVAELSGKIGRLQVERSQLLEKIEMLEITSEE